MTFSAASLNWQLLCQVLLSPVTVNALHALHNPCLIRIAGVLMALYVYMCCYLLHQWLPIFHLCSSSHQLIKTLKACKCCRAWK